MKCDIIYKKYLKIWRKHVTFNFDKEFHFIMQKHDLNTVIILGHLNLDGDAAGSVMGLAHYRKVVNC